MANGSTAAELDLAQQTYGPIVGNRWIQLAAGVTADSIGKVKAGELVNFVARQVGGKGGGKPDLAMAGGTDASKLSAALDSVQGWVAQRCNS